LVSNQPDPKLGFEDGTLLKAVMRFPREKLMMPLKDWRRHVAVSKPIIQSPTFSNW
jgi:hypothetical protein